MNMSRRTFIKYAQTAGLFYSTASFSGLAHAYSANKGLPLIPDPAEIIDLPEKFSYTVVSIPGQKMADNFFRPGRPDGMTCFPYPGNRRKCILMRNHENWLDTLTGSPFGEGDLLAKDLDDKKLYDRNADGRPYLGGVTKVVYDLKKKRLEQDFLVLAGTVGNCAGGPTPWGSWLSCEEAMLTPAESGGKYHGFVFETPSSASGLVEPVPLKAMGRFAHEAAAVDPDTGIVYLTEDNMAGLFYRFLPNTPGELVKGGRLQALAIKGQKSFDTRNWSIDWGSTGFDTVAQGQIFATEWIDVDDVESPNADLNDRGFAAGAARFCRGEGIAYTRQPDGSAEVFFNCTQGGAQRTGQVWCYAPGASADSTGHLKLIYESASADHLDLCDNLAVAPWGDLILCEDGYGDQYLRGLTPTGQIYDLARNADAGKSEFCGACFSPDGSVLFVNIQEPGFTLAIEGPWKTLRS